MINTIEEAGNFIYNTTLSDCKSQDQLKLGKKLFECEKLAIEANDLKLLCRTRIFLTSYYVQINDLQHALTTGLDSKKMAFDNQMEEEELQSYSGLVSTYIALGDYASLEELINEYREKLINKNDNRRLASSYIITAMQNENLKNQEQTIINFEKAILYAEKSDDVEIVFTCYNNFGYSLLNIDLQKSEYYLLKAMKLYNKHDKILNSIFYILIHNNLGNLYLRKNDFDKSKKYIKQSLQKANKINNKSFYTESLISISKLYFKIDDFQQAIHYLKEVELILTLSENVQLLIECYFCFYEIYASTKEFNKALEYHIKYHQLYEQIYNTESDKKIRNLQIIHEVNTIKRERDFANSLANIKHDFLANMSHEIRTPINSILGIAYLLEQDRLNTKQQNYINRLISNSNSLLSIINDVLDISKIEAGKFDLVTEPFSIIETIEEVMQQLTYKAQEKKLVFEFINKTNFNASTLFYGDSNRLKQILINLLSNALKFTEKGSVQLFLNFENDLITIRIKDTGIGIPKAKINSLFGKYEQATADTANKFGGTGLGLSISKKLTELMKGIISIESKLGVGSLFKIEIPFESLNTNTNFVEQELEEQKIDYDTLRNCKILIADDNEDNRTITAELLTHFCAELTILFAENGQIAIELANKHMPDLILMDLDMPVKNGMEATFELRKIHSTATLKIIATTASLVTLTKNEFIEIGFDDLIQKPYLPKLFIQQIIDACKKLSDKFN